MQRQGLTLAAIRRVVDGELGLADAGLAAAVAAERADATVGESLSLDAFSSASGVPASLIQAVEREGIRIGQEVDGETRYTSGDIELVRTALRLLEFGLPLGTCSRSHVMRTRHCGASPIAPSSSSTTTCGSRSGTRPREPMRRRPAWSRRSGSCFPR